MSCRGGLPTRESTSALANRAAATAGESNTRRSAPRTAYPRLRSNALAQPTTRNAHRIGSVLGSAVNIPAFQPNLPVPMALDLQPVDGCQEFAIASSK
jgi:hypothetical protein